MAARTVATFASSFWPFIRNRSRDASLLANGLLLHAVPILPPPKMRILGGGRIRVGFARSVYLRQCRPFRPVRIVAYLKIRIQSTLKVRANPVSTCACW